MRIAGGSRLRLHAPRPAGGASLDGSPRTTRRSAMSNSANGVGSGCPASRWLDAMTCWLTGCIACASVIHRHPCWTPGSMPHASTTSRVPLQTANPRPPTASSAGRTPGAAPAAADRADTGRLCRAIAPLHEAGSVLNARDAATPLRFVESVYSMGEWISPHRLTRTWTSCSGAPRPTKPWPVSPPQRLCAGSVAAFRHG